MTPPDINTLLDYSSQELELEVLRRSYERTEKIIADLETSVVNLRKKQFAREREMQAATERIAKAKETAP